MSRYVRPSQNIYRRLVSPKSQYRYFLSLDKTVRFAAAFYVVVLLAGTAAIWLGLERLARDVQSGHDRIPLLLAGSMVLAFAAFLYAAGKVTWISDVHEWMDGYFFRLLEKSNVILFNGLIAGLEPEERSGAYDGEGRPRTSLANAVFTGLAENTSLFTHLLRTQIFRWWIWYWISMYGTLVFTALTVESFSLVLRGADHYAKAAFTVAWVLALAHLSFGALLGRKLLWMTGDLAGLLVRAHKEDIVAMLRKGMSGT